MKNASYKLKGRWIARYHRWSSIFKRLYAARISDESPLLMALALFNVRRASLKSLLLCVGFKSAIPIMAAARVVHKTMTRPKESLIKSTEVNGNTLSCS